MADIQSCTSLQKEEEKEKNAITIKALEVSHISWRVKIVSAENKLAAQSRLLLEKI